MEPAFGPLVAAYSTPVFPIRSPDLYLVMNYYYWLLHLACQFLARSSSL
jgi:hypothetical protein